jgi:hypothetical protein
VISPGASPADGGATTMSARRPPELVSAASMPGYLSSIASARRLPIADSFKRVGSRRMSTDWLPITWLRSTAVSALGRSTIACTSAREATPMFLAVRVDVPAQTTSDPRIISCATE